MKKSYIIAITVAVLVAVIAFAAPSIMGMFAKMEPADHVAYAFMETSKIKKANMTMEMEMTIDQEAADAMGIFEGAEDPVAMGNYVNSILENVSIYYDVTMAQDDKFMPTYLDYEMGVDYKNMALFAGDFVFEPWKIAFGSEQVYDKMFAMDIEDVIEEVLNAEGISMDDIDLDKYVDVILNDSDDLYKNAMDNTEAYETLIMGYLEENLVKLDDGTLTIEYDGKIEDVKVTKYNMPLDMATYFTKLQEFMIIFKDDANMQALIKDRVFALVDLFISSGDYALMGLELAEVEEMRATLEAEYDTEMEMALNEIIVTYSSMDADMAELDMDISYDITFMIDDKNRLRGSEVNVLSSFIKMKQMVTYNAFDDDVIIENINMENSVDLIELIEDEEKAIELSQEVMGNVFTKVFSGEAFNTLVTDMEINAEMLPEAERAEIVESIQGALSMLPFLLQGGM